MSTSVAEWTIAPAPAVRGTLVPPGDKSVSHRALLLGAIAQGTARIDGFLPAGDCLSTLGVLQRLGVPIRFLNAARTAVEITGRGLGGLVAPEGDEPLDCGNSGTTMRHMVGLLSAHGFRSVLTGDASLSARPMKRIVEPLRAMGARITGPDDAAHAPLAIEGGPLKGLSFDLPIASAQVKSSILIAGLHASGSTRVRQPARSRDHTERQLLRLGAAFREEADGWLCVEGGHPLTATPTRVPGDISAAAFFLVAAACSMRAELTVEGVGVNPTRTGVLDVLRKMGANLAIVNEREESGEPVADLVVRGGAPLKGVRIAGELIPRLIDELPALAVAACFADGVTVIRDAGELRAKETDRIAAMAGELGSMGAKIGVLPDGLAIEGGAALTGRTVHSHGDHRIAMALAIAALGAAGETRVEDAGCVEISYPAFLADLRRLTGVAG